MLPQSQSPGHDLRSAMQWNLQPPCLAPSPEQDLQLGSRRRFTAFVSKMLESSLVRQGAVWRGLHADVTRVTLECPWGFLRPELSCGVGWGFTPVCTIHPLTPPKPSEKTEGQESLLMSQLSEQNRRAPPDNICSVSLLF